MAGLSEIAATTFEHREKKPADAVADNDPLLFHLRKLGNIEEIDGGRVIWEDLHFAQNQYYQAIDPTQEIVIGYNQTITGFEFSPKIAVVPVVITTLERAQNQGKAQFRNLLKSRLKVGEDTMKNNLEADLQGDGTGRGGKAFAGIKAYISKTPSLGTVGGISRATVTSIRNVAVNAPSTFTGATTAQNIEARLRATKNKLVRNQDRPTLCLAGENYYNLACDALSAKQRFVKDAEMYEAGFDNVKIEGMTMVLASGLQFSGLTRIGTSEAYLINPNTMKLKMYKGYNMQPMPERHAVHQLVECSLQVAIGNLTTNNPALNGVMFES